LHDAAKKGDVALIAKLLDEGADVNKRSAIATPLYFAVQENHPEAVKLLLQRGADANGESVGGTALQSAARTGSAEMASLLLEHGANPNAASKDGVNALHFAAQKGHLEVVKLLLDKGADVGAVNIHGEPALHFAMIGGHNDVARLLVVRGSKAPAVEPLGDSVRTADVEHGKALIGQCQHCHILEKGGKTKVGPPLWNVLGRDKASFPEFEYSNALKSAEGKWTYEDLNRLIAHPGWEFPGTSMKIEPVTKASDRADVIGYLRTLSDEPVPLP
jgi:cytochrome c